MTFQNTTLNHNVTFVIDANSYASGDEVNNIRWDDLAAGSEVMNMRDYYRSLIAMRKANDFITKGELTCTVVRENAVEAVWTQDGKTVAYALINPTVNAMDWPLPEGEWGVLMMNDSIVAEPTETVSGTLKVDSRTVLLVKAK